jgi:hypothetical protein
VINRKTANVFGIKITRELPSRADRLIEESCDFPQFGKLNGANGPA